MFPQESTNGRDVSFSVGEHRHVPLRDGKQGGVGHG
jgi:hypothetical protein